MKRREFLKDSAGLAGVLLPAIVHAQSKPCPPPSLGATGGTSVATGCGSGAAEADWLSRIAVPGVIWHHDFRSATEVDQFREYNGYMTPSVAATDGNCTQEWDDDLGRNVLQLRIPSNTLATVAKMVAVSSTAVNVTTRTPHGLAVGSRVLFMGLPSPWATFNDSSGGGSGVTEQYNVTAVDGLTFTIYTDRTDQSGDNPVDARGFAAYDSGASGYSMTSNLCNSAWKRPFAAIRAGDNGKPDNDPGAPLRAWDSSDRNENYNWQNDYYGHADYAAQTSATPQLNYKNWAGNADAFRGTDFWIQFRVKISSSRFQPANAFPRNPSGKLAFIATSSTTPLHEVLIMSENTQALSPGYKTAWFRCYTGKGSTHFLSKEPGDRRQPGGAYNSTCYYDGNNISPGCWAWPADEWVTMLFHVVPGKDQLNWGNWPSPSASGNTGVQVWVARQSQLGSGYVKLLDGEWPFQYETYDGSNPGIRNPPAWNAFTPSGYMNNVPAPFGWTQRFDQIIFKKGAGLPYDSNVNPETAGIPCPKV